MRLQSEQREKTTVLFLASAEQTGLGIKSMSLVLNILSL